MSDDLDRARIAALAKPMMAAIRANYLQGPVSLDRVFEALNALAFCAATVIAGTGDRTARRDARRFLDQALDQNTADLVRNPPVGTAH